METLHAAHDLSHSRTQDTFFEHKHNQKILLDVSYV